MGHRNRYRPDLRVANRAAPSIEPTQVVQPFGKRELRVVPVDGNTALRADMLPFGMRPAPAFAEDLTEPVDLGKYNPKFAGMQVVFNQTLDLSIQDILERMRDKAISEIARSQAAKAFLKKVLAGWNFTRARRDANGHLVTEYLPQPPAGVEELPVSLELLVAIIQAFGSEFHPDPNS